jgi:hypothetical protein
LFSFDKENQKTAGAPAGLLLFMSVHFVQKIHANQWPGNEVSRKVFWRHLFYKKGGKKVCNRASKDKRKWLSLQVL